MDLIEREFIPLDKSWIIRLGFLDIINGYKDITLFLEKRNDLGDDLKALLNISKNWEKNEIDVGESGTLYRFFKFASWKLNLNKKFILHGTLKERKICDDFRIVNWPLKELLKLDNGTSQWASVSVLLGNEEVLDGELPFKLKLTYEAKKHWEENRKMKKRWEERYDRTILNQAEAFINLIQRNEIKFVAEQAEDYCFSRAFNLISKEEGEQRWKSLRGHESDRIDEMEIALSQYRKGEIINSKDHRIVQAIAMLSIFERKEARFSSPDCVKKSWPKFWDFLKFF